MTIRESPKVVAPGTQSELENSLEAQRPPTTDLVVVTAGTGQPSTSRLLAERITRSTVTALAQHGLTASTRIIELAPLSPVIGQAMVSGSVDPALTEVTASLGSADAVIAVTPVYKAGISGLFKSFVDILENDLLIATPILLAATGGTARHASVIDDQMRPLFAFMRALPTPTSIYAAPEDWAGSGLVTRIERTANELAALIKSGIRETISAASWGQYQHEFGNQRTDTTDGAPELDTDLMRLAAGGAARARPTQRP